MPLPFFNNEEIEKNMNIPLPEALPLAQINTLFNALAPFECRLVGGVVRALVLGESVENIDIDVATTATPEEVITSLQKAHIKTVPVGVAHGTVLAVVDGQPFEITTLRRDVETDGRHAKVVFTTSFEEDAKRRDFTFNALYMDLNGNLTDLTGGVKDLKAGVVRFIGDASERIEEDALRILRFFRFFAFYGAVKPDDNTMKALVSKADLLNNLSAERVTQELLKLLSAPNAAMAWKMMEKSEILAEISLQGDNHVDVDALSRHQALFPDVINPVERFVCLFGLYSAMVASESLLTFSNQQIAFIVQTVETLSTMHADDDVSVLLYDHKRPVLEAALRIMAADADLHKQYDEREAITNRLIEIANTEIPTFPLKGEDVVEMGIEPGPVVGEILSQIEDWWQATGFPNREECLAELAFLLEKRA